MDSPLIPTGYASTCRLTAKELTKRGWEVFATSFNGGTQSEEIMDWYGIKVVPNHALKRNPNAMYGDAGNVLQLYADLKPDILFFHNDIYRYSYLAELPKEILDRSIAWIPFEGEGADIHGVQILSKLAATRFVTDGAYQLHKEMMAKNDAGQIYHAIDLDSYSLPINKKELKKAKSLGIENKFLVVRVDRHQPRKYWDLTLKAFAQFANNKSDVFLLGKCHPRDIVMWDDAKKEGVDLDALARELNIKDKVLFDDYFFSTPAMADCFYKPADVFLTTTSGEGFGLSLVESMACGTPVICPNVPVLPEVCGEAALYCKVKEKQWYNPMSVFHNVVDVDSVVEKLEWAYQDWKQGSKKLIEMGKKGREITEKKFSPKVVYDQWDKVFKDVIRKRDTVSLVTILYNVTKEQIDGEDGIEKFKSSIDKYVTSPYEWIIVDNGSPAKEETRTWLEKAKASNPNIKPVYLETNLGFAGGCNVGISKALGQWVVLANPDCEALDPKKLSMQYDFLRMLVDKAKSDPYIGIVGMELNRRDDVLLGSMFPYFCCVLITRTCLDACKLGEDKWFDEAFWPGYYEDADLVLRAIGKGFKVIEHNVPFWHKSGGTNKHAIEGGAKGPVVKHLASAIDTLSKEKPIMADFNRKRGELAINGMQSLIQGNIAYLQNKWGPEARSKIKIVWDTHIGAAVGFSEIAEGLIPELHRLGFDVYVNDWSNGSKVEDPLIKKLIEKTRKANEESDGLDNAIHVIAWLMETFMNVDAEFKVGISLCESTKVRPQYLQACNSMDRILTFSEFCRGVQKNSGFTSPINVIPPGIHPIYLNYYERPQKDKFTFLDVGVSQERKDTYRLVQAFCETFPKHTAIPPECEPSFPLKCSQVELVLKSNNFGELDWVQKQGFDKIANIRTIFTGWDQRAQRKDYNRQEMYDLYCSADCFVHPSHGEGIGYGQLESAATGLPIIFTNWSSPVEYFNDSNSYPCSLGPNGTDFSNAYPGHGIPGENGVWANCHVGHMKFLMRNVIRNRQEAKEKGKRAAEEMKSKYTWQESARHLIPLIFEWEAERKRKVNVTSFDPMTFEKPKLEPVKKGDRIMVDLCSRDRKSYLCCLLISLLNQTFKNWDIIIECDDSDESMPNDFQILALMERCTHEGHGWKIIRSHQQGPHIAHDRTLQITRDNPTYKYKLICRIDDDIFLRPDYLENLFNVFLDEPEAAAVGGVYPDPKRPERDQMAPAGYEKDINYAGKIDLNVPWPYVCLYPPETKPRLVEHLYSSFLYRVEAATAIGGYCRRFSQIGHREESDFSYRFHLAGWKLFIQPKSIGFHFCAPSGGIRSQAINEKQKLAESDHKIYLRRIATWKKRAEQRKIADAQKNTPIAKDFVKHKIATVINGGNSLDKVFEAIERFSPWSDEIYVTSLNPKLKSLVSSKLKMVATDPEEAAILTKALLSDGDHEFVATVTDSMVFKVPPTSFINDSYDDYVFEVFKTYIPGRTIEFNKESVFVQDESIGTVIGPECQNTCLLTRRRKDSTSKMERIYYCDSLVLDNERLSPSVGKSSMGNQLIPLADIEKIKWTKFCTYQYPEGILTPPKYLEMNPSAAVLVSIILPTVCRKQLLKQSIDSVFAHTSTPFEIIVIDNGSTDGTVEYLAAESQKRPQIKVVRQNENLGFQKAVNIGVSMAKGEYILLWNDDAWVQGREPDGRDWLSVYVDELKVDPKLGLIGPHGCDSPTLKHRMLFFWCVMFRKSLWDIVGTLDDVTFKNYCGDDDYSHRVLEAGFKIKEIPTNLRHLMNLIPDHVKRPELEEAGKKLRAKYEKS